MPQDEMSLAAFIAHPLATITAAVALVGGYLPTGVLDPVVGTLWSQSGALFAAFSVSATQLTGVVEWLPKRGLEVAAVVFALVFVANRLWKVYSGYTTRTEEKQ